MIHLPSSQEEMHAAFQLLADSEHSQLQSPVEYPPITVHTYPKVPSNPPFPFKSKAPALVQARETSSLDPYVRSATNLSYSRTLALLRRELGPHFDLERLWERHTHYEFVERDASKTMSTMVIQSSTTCAASLTFVLLTGQGSLCQSCSHFDRWRRAGRLGSVL
ncbi:hypothetical protein B0F90DRAFT_1678161 [Multifurca ochricompacta]|uniref:Uncharacterized protein n=1 Tax=Multifurca ochricompacta TaxID=376703 RepID=A0AAD4MCL0_9AGAM|nr:hypothetical protein B0F90DRAFT_1678161 [Multifurca ochricompacta]